MDDFKENADFPLVFKKIQRKSFSHNSQTIRRFMSKTGHLNLQLGQVPYHKYLRFTKDFANTLVLIRWRWVTLFVILANSFFYLCFAGLWMFDAWLSGDLDGTKTGNFCIKATRHFTGYLLLSVETITTTGYGYLYPSEHCYLALALLILSTLVMIFIDGAFMSVVFLKICKPPRRNASTLFSKRAVISLRNGKLCLILRIDDHLSRHVIDPKITLYYADRRNVKEENFQIDLQEMETEPIGMLLWPTDVVHEINQKSPLWNLSPTDLMNSRFEIFATVSGSSFVTNQFSTSQTSYLNEEILWGYCFKSCMEFDEKLQRYTINEQELFKIVPCDTPLCSPSKLKRIKHELQRKSRWTVKTAP